MALVALGRPTRSCSTCTMRSLRLTPLGLCLVLGSVGAAAQSPQSGSSLLSPNSPNSDVPPSLAKSIAEAAGALAAGGETTAAEPEVKLGSHNVIGYAYRDGPTKAPTEVPTKVRGAVATTLATTPSRHAPRRTATVLAGPVATRTGFEEVEGGGSRLVVALSAMAPVEERRSAGTLVYVLRGVHVRRSNDLNPLVTVHFNTPVWEARLVPQGNDLEFRVDLRATSAPSFRVAEAPDHSATLTIDFAKGEFADLLKPRASSALQPGSQGKPSAHRRSVSAPPAN